MWVSIGEELVEARHVESIVALTIYHRLLVHLHVLQADEAGMLPTSGSTLTVCTVIDDWKSWSGRHGSGLVVAVEGKKMVDWLIGSLSVLLIEADSDATTQDTNATASQRWLCAALCSYSERSHFDLWIRSKVRQADKAQCMRRQSTMTLKNP